MKNDHRHRRCFRWVSLRGSLLSIFNSQFSIFNSKFSILNSHFSIFNSQFSIFILSLLLTSCYTNRYIPDGSHRLDETEQTVAMADGSEVTPEVMDALKNAENYYVQRRNSKVFGVRWLPVGMWIYSVASPTDSSFWGNYWRRLGQAPVVYDEDKSRRTARQLQGLLETKGCFNSTATFDTLEMKGKKIKIGYHLTATHRYLVEEVIYHTQNDTIRKLLDKWEPSSPLKAGTYYDQEILAAERSRLVSLLREEGYFRASADNITFLVDTTYNDRKLSIDVNVDSRNLRLYHINNIYIFPNNTAGIRNGEVPLDTTLFNYEGLHRQFEFNFISDPTKTIKPNKGTISRSMKLLPGMLYRPSRITATYNSLLNLKNFKYINIEFTESASSTNDRPLVDAHVRLLNAQQQKISLSLELTNASPIGATDSASNFFTSGNLGIETTLEYQHRNLFGGAELLKVKSSLLLELPKFILQSGGGSFYDNFSTFEVNLDASLNVPNAIPFSPNYYYWSQISPHTLINLGGSYQYRYWFERILANTSFGYTWTVRSNDRRRTTDKHYTIQHQLLPIELTFVRVINIDDDFTARLRAINDLRINYQYSSHFIIDARYDFAYSNQQFGTRKNFSLLRLSVESAGNLLKGYSKLAGVTSDSNGIHQIFGVPFAQYFRVNTEFTRYMYHFQRCSLVARLLLGAGIPYGNSLSMPYEKSFFGGGPTTMRAWQLRHLGPGSYNHGDNMIERVGDLQLVLNLEERFPIAGIFEGAVFADMGNVWLLNPSDQYPGGELKWGEILNEIAVGVGFGIRLNISIATLRLDFAIPLYDPGYDESYRWRPPHWAFNQIVTNFGINYPF